MSTLIFPKGHSYIRYSYDEDEDIYHLPTDWLANFKWTGREDYLEWVASWKACLKDQIKAIHAERTKRRDKTASIESRTAANQERQQLRIDCFNLMLIRKMGKRESAKQRDDRRNSIGNSIAA